METPTRILLIEDDIPLAAWISDFLLSKGLEVHHFARGDQALTKWQNHQPDLILLDLMLPGANGLDICKHIRKTSSVPILMLTAQGEELDEVLGLELGANDYLVKPVRPRALLARIQATLRQSQALPDTNASSASLRFGQLELQPQSHRVMLEQQALALSVNEFDLLWYLANRAGIIVSRQDLFRKLTGRDYDGLDRRVDVLVSSLRRKLGDDAHDPQRIKTIWGKGYLFVADAWQ